MPEPTNKILIEEELRPAYYDDFRCLAGACQLTCCKGWHITFRKKDYLALKRLKDSPDLNARLESGLRRIRPGEALSGKFYGEFVLRDDGACPLLRKDGLCALQCEKGAGALPPVCRDYPRVERCLPSGYLERALSPSCEGVLALLWDLPEGIEFRTAPLPKEKRQWIYPEGRMPLWFAAVREWCVDLLQDRRFPLPQRIWLMGAGLRELAEGETDIQRWMERAAALPDSAGDPPFLPAGNRELAMYLAHCAHMLPSLGGEHPQLIAVRDRIMARLGLDPNMNTQRIAVPLEGYRQAQVRYEQQFGERAYFMENLMVSVFFYQWMPRMDSPDKLWESYVNFCNLYAVYRFMAVLSCWEGADGDREELFRGIVLVSRYLVHNEVQQSALRQELFQHDSATLAHMAVLLCG